MDLPKLETNNFEGGDLEDETVGSQLRSQNTLAHIINPEGHNINNCDICEEIKYAVKSEHGRVLKLIKQFITYQKE